MLPLPAGLLGSSIKRPVSPGGCSPSHLLQPVHKRGAFCGNVVVLLVLFWSPCPPRHDPAGSSSSRVSQWTVNYFTYLCYPIACDDYAECRTAP